MLSCGVISIVLEDEFNLFKIKIASRYSALSIKYEAKRISSETEMFCDFIEKEKRKKKRKKNVLIEFLLPRLFGDFILVAPTFKSGLKMIITLTPKFLFCRNAKKKFRKMRGRLLIPAINGGATEIFDL